MECTTSTTPCTDISTPCTDTSTVPSLACMYGDDILRCACVVQQRCNFRSLVVRPRDLTFKIVGYKDRDSDLTAAMVEASDASVDRDASDGEAGRGEGNAGAQGPKGHEGPGQIWSALVLSFTLPPSSYATMMAREVIYVGTGGNTHTETQRSSHAVQRRAVHACTRAFG